MQPRDKGHEKLKSHKIDITLDVVVSNTQKFIVISKSSEMPILYLLLEKSFVNPTVFVVFGKKFIFNHFCSFMLYYSHYVIFMLMFFLYLRFSHIFSKRQT